MNLQKKKDLAARTLAVGRERIVFNKERLNEIKEAITKQDIRDLVASKAISIREVNGRTKKEKRSRRRGMGSIRKKAFNKKRAYMQVTRKLRVFVFNARKKGQIDRDQYYELRKEIRASNFDTLSHLKERIGEMKK